MVSGIAIRDRLYVGAADGNLLRALDRATGNGVVWAYQAGAAIVSGVSLGPNGTIRFGTGNGRVISLCGRRWNAPTLRWVANSAAGRSFRRPVDRDGNIYVGGNDHKVHKPAAANGADCGAA